MSKAENQELVLANRPNGLKDLKNIWKLQSLPIPKAGENEVVFETLYISVDPYLSSGLKKSALGGATNEIGSVQKSLTVVKVIESNNEKYPVGTVVLAINPWQRFFVHKGDNLPWGKIIKKPGDPENAFDRLGHQSALGAFGMPSMTGYYGIKDVGKYTSNDIIVVSGAAGGVGSVAGQYAKHVIKCKKVIGTAGGKDKCDYLVKELGFDAAVDYKEYNTKEKMAKRLQELAGEPITGYFDNTGGHVTDAIFDIIAKFGKIVICGQISTYNNSEESEKETNIYPNYLAKTIYKSLTVIGYTVADFMSRNEKEFYAEMPSFIEKGLIKTKDTIVEGFEKTPEAYEMLYTGANTGKVIVKI